MANFSGTADALLGLTDFAGVGADRAYNDAVTASKAGVEAFPQGGGTAGPSAHAEAPSGPVTRNLILMASANYVGCEPDLASVGAEWYGEIHVIPRVFALGNILSTVTDSIEIFNADFVDHTLDAFTNTAGAGTSITNLPSLPAALGSFGGLTLNFQVTTDGPPVIDGLLIFDFDLYTTPIVVTGIRVVMFQYIPESPVGESLQFLTEIYESLDGSEQRVKLRKNPRSTMRLQFRVDGRTRARIETLLFGWQGRVFGVPSWWEPTYLTAEASSAATSLSVSDTTLSDFRVDGLVMIFTDEDNFDVQEIDSKTSTTITLKSGLNATFGAGTQIYPVRTAYATDNVVGSRRPVKEAALDVTFLVLDNDSDIGSTAGFSSYNSKVLFDDPNALQELPSSLTRRFYTQDGNTGTFLIEGAWDQHKWVAEKAFIARTPEERWALIQVLHALGGRLTSFYIPTFYDDLQPVAALVISTATMTIANIGYSTYIEAASSRTKIRVVLTDGTAIERTILSSVEVDADTETLTMTENWSANYALDDIARVEYIMHVRFDTDTFRIQHDNQVGLTTVGATIKEVLGE